MDKRPKPQISISKSKVAELEFETWDLKLEIWNDGEYSRL